MHEMSLKFNSLHILAPQRGFSQKGVAKTVYLSRFAPNKYLPSRLRLHQQSNEFSLSYGLGKKDGVIIVDHGSRRNESNLMLIEFAAMFKEKTGYPIVEPAHMELAKPSIKDAFNLCVQQGANRVIVSPFFLFPGRHWNQDIPALAHDAAKEHPDVSYIVTAPLGLHHLLVDVLNDRIKYCLSHAEGHQGECSVCAGTGKCQLITQSWS